jgi:hypothetical protein
MDPETGNSGMLLSNPSFNLYTRKVSELLSLPTREELRQVK